jgi:Leucine-rich repeat (LRR) protein
MGLISLLLVVTIMVFGGMYFFDQNTKNTATNYLEERVNIKETVNDTVEQVVPDSIIEKTSKENINNNTTLDLKNQNLSKLPENIFSKTSLTTLDVSHNKLSGAMPAEIRHLKNLKTLDLSHNNFTGVPAEIGQLSNLEVLNLSYNPITGLPYELGNLKNLKTLDLRGTNYAKQDLDKIKAGLSEGITILVD